MTDPRVKRFAEAKKAVEDLFVNPVQELLEATTSLVTWTRMELRQQKEYTESMRPHWAQGYTSDSQAAQAQTSALSDVWDFLGVDNQTACMEKLRELKENQCSI